MRDLDCAPMRSYPGGAPSLLVGDDDADVREVTVTRLVEAGYATKQAGSGLQALAALEADPCVDLAIMDSRGRA